MKKHNVLITGAGGDIGSSAVKILLNHKIIEKISICDLSTNVPFKSLTHKFYKIKNSNENEYKDQIVKIINQDNIDLIIPTTEKEIKYFDKNKLFFNNLGIKLLINDSFFIDIFFDKYKTSQAVKKIGLLSPKTEIFDKNIPQQFRYPYYIKLRESSGGKGVFLIENSDDEYYYTNKFDNIVMQEKVGTIDKEYTMTIFSDGQVSKNIVFRRTLGYGSLSKQVSIVCRKEFNDVAKIFLNNFSFTGSMNIQFREENNDLFIFEINPRLSSTLSFRDHFGFKDLVWWVNSVLGIKNDYDGIKQKGHGLKYLVEEYY